MKVLGYIRVSTHEQSERGLGLAIQEAAIRKWAKANGHRLTAVYTDAGVSGTNGIDTRSGLPEAIADLRDGEAGALVVYRLDRLARDLIIQETLLAEVKRIGAAVFSTAASEAAYLADDPDDPSRKLIRQVLGAVSEYERAMVTLRLRSGRRAKAARGGFIGGPTAYGYRVANKALELDPATSAVLADMQEWREAGASYREIVERLQALNVPSPTGGDWYPMTVRRILNREAQQ